LWRKLWAGLGYGAIKETSVKRLHVHVSAKDLDASVRFYSQLFATDPTVHKSDYTKWMLENPRVNSAISPRNGRPGVQHLGIQVEDRTDLRMSMGDCDVRRGR